MGETEAQKIVALLDGVGVPFEIIEHAPVFTSADAAKTRNAPLPAGVKAIVFRSSEGTFVLGCVPGDCKIDTKKLALLSGSKSLQLATPQQVLQQTGCEIGSVSPFGNVYGVPTFFDVRIRENIFVEFNIGLHTKSIRMHPAALCAVVGATQGDFARL